MRNPTQEEMNKYLTEAVGECWHEWEEDWHDACSAYTHWICKRCEEGFSRADVDVKYGDAKPYQNNFFTWEGFGKLWKWWFDFGWNYFPSTIDQLDGLGEHMEIAMLRNLINPERFATAIYNFLKGREK